jgi:hypothetical protein
VLNFTQQVWHRIKGGLNLKNDWEGSSLNACYDSWVKKERNYITLPPLVSWFIWLERNKIFFENDNPSISSVVYKSIGKVVNTLDSQKVAISRTLPDTSSRKDNHWLV